MDSIIRIIWFNKLFITDKQEWSMLLGYKEYIDELLFEAKSPEEMFRILSYKHQEMPESIIKKLVDIDPTKKKSYATWVLNVENDPRKINSYLNSGKLAKIFDYFRKNANEGASLVDKQSIEDAENYLPDFNKIFSYDEKNPEANDYEITYESPEWIVATPKSYAASEKLGENTRWCTAGAYGNGLHYYNDYTRSGPLWINFDKRHTEVLNGVTYPFKRYQFCFERKAFLDAHDAPFDWEDLEMPESVQEMYKKRGYDLTDLMMSEEERWEVYSMHRAEDGVNVFGSLELMRLWDDDMEWREEEDPDYYLYNTDYDSTDTITNSETYARDSIIFADEELEYAILKERYGDSYTVAIRQTTGTRYGNDINLYTGIKNYKQLGRDGRLYVAYIYENNDQLVYIAPEGQFFVENETEARTFSTESDIFLNKALSTSDSEMYIEVSDNGIHTLYKVDFSETNLKEIVYSDIPVNGKYFTVNENGEIFGKYGTYPLTLYTSLQDEVTRYTPVKFLENNDIIMCRNQFGTYNLFSKNEINKKLLHNDFEKLIEDLSDSNYNGVIVQTKTNKNGTSEKCLVSISNGAPISQEYEYMQTGKNKQIVVAAKGQVSKEGQMTPVDGRYIITGHGDIPVKDVYPYCVNGKTPVYIQGDNGQINFRVFNMSTMDFSADWIVGKVKYLGYSNGENDYVIAKDTSGALNLYNWVDNRVITSGISNKEQPIHLQNDQYVNVNENLFLIRYTDDTYNIFNKISDKMLLSQRPTKIVADINRNTRTTFAMLSYNGGEKNYFVEISADGLKIKKLLNGKPIVSSGHEISPKIVGNSVTLTIDSDRNKVFHLNLDNGSISCFGIRPNANYGEVPIQQAPDGAKNLASQIFPWLTSNVQSLSERINNVRK